MRHSILLSSPHALTYSPAGSSDLWVPSKDCSSSVCSQKSSYDASSSDTSKKASGKFQIQYGDGSTVSGPVYQDTVTVAGVTAKNQYFSPVTTLSDSFSNDPIDGILGLAYPAISNLKQDPWFTNANSQGAVDKNSFGFYLAKTGSELYLGGANDKLYSGDVEYHDVDKSEGFWLITGASISVDGKSAADSFDTIIDSGTTRECASDSLDRAAADGVSSRVRPPGRHRGCLFQD